MEYVGKRELMHQCVSSSRVYSDCPIRKSSKLDWDVGRYVGDLGGRGEAICRMCGRVLCAEVMLMERGNLVGVAGGGT